MTLMSRTLISLAHVPLSSVFQLSFCPKPRPVWTQSFIPPDDSQSGIVEGSKQLPNNKYSISLIFTPSAHFIYKALEERQGARSGCKGGFLLEGSATAFPPPAVNSPEGKLISKGRSNGWEREASAGGENWIDSHCLHGEVTYTPHASTSGSVSQIVCYIFLEISLFLEIPLVSQIVRGCAITLIWLSIHWDWHFWLWN